ncbi:hypothetical protein RB96_04100 [Campylobacter jejuni]|nr:hypothetical protein RB96_04100 [Campylobacter jejuni]
MSIFSINDNSNYNSILSQAKANKESKENSKISFANAFLKQNASKLRFCKFIKKLCTRWLA